MTICLMAGDILGFFIATGLDVPSFEIVGYRNSVSHNAFVLSASAERANDLTATDRGCFADRGGTVFTVEAPTGRG